MSATASAQIQKPSVVKTVIKRKRMLLSEVYVHKKRMKVGNQNAENNDYEVFHIYELEDDKNTKITPKLSTNCTEPDKIINALKNSSGSETPQLKRLINKLCFQSMYFIT